MAIYQKALSGNFFVTKQGEVSIYGSEWIACPALVAGEMPRRGVQSGSEYRFGFNGMEKDDEWKGDGNSYDFGGRMYDARLGRFFSVDPLEPDYPWNSPYAFSENRVVDSRELEGLERVKSVTLRVARPQRKNEERGGRQEKKGVLCGDFYGGAKTGVGFQLGNTQRPKPISQILDIKPFAVLEPRRISKIREDIHFPLRDPNSITFVEKSEPDSAPGRQGGSRPVTPGTFLQYPEDSNPWHADSGEIGDPTHTFIPWIRETVARLNNSLGISQIQVIASLRPSNWKVFNPDIDVQQRSMITLGSFRAANNIAELLRASGLNPKIKIVVLNTPGSILGIRFGNNADRPGVSINVR